MPGDSAALELQIGGMTCASCAQRVEKTLNRLEGVTASVNYATERAHVVAPPAVDSAALIAAVVRTGYTARVPPAAPTGRGEAGREDARHDVAEHGQAGDDLDGDAELRSLRRRMIGALGLAVPVIALSMIPALQFDYWGFAGLVLAAPVVLWAGWPFHRATWANLRHGAATMDTLISLGTGAALIWSIVALFFGTAGQPGMHHGFAWRVSRGDGMGNLYLEVAAGVVAFVLVGRYVEKRSKRRAGAALRALLRLGAKEVSVLRPGADGARIERRIDLAELGVGEEFVLRPGEKVATDGVVVAGCSAVDASMLTGESVPVEVAAGDEVIGGCVNAGGRLVVRATRVGADTQLAQMGRLVERAQSGKASAQRLADRVSGIFVPVVLVVAVATLVGWLMAGYPPAAAFTSAVAVLIIACPCALGLATPTALLVGTGRGAQLGVLIKGPEVLESTRRVDTVVLDKTGTITAGAMTLAEVIVADGVPRGQLLRLAGAVEGASEHPIARAVARGAAAEVGGLPEVAGFVNLPGEGVRGEVEGHTVLIGREPLLPGGPAPDASLVAARRAAEAAGDTAVVVAWDGRARGVLVVADAVRASSAEAVAQLAALGLRPVLLTGDARAVAERVAAEVGIEEVYAEVLPGDKAALIARLQGQGRTVAMVGDGVNDAPALATADLGLAMGTGTDAAIEAADITLVRGDLRAVGDAIRLSRRTLATIRANLFWAFAYNTAAIPLAALGLLNPMLAGAAMALSSVFVVSNSLRLRRFRSSAGEAR